MKFTKMATVAAVLVAYVCSISFDVLGAWAGSTPTFSTDSISGTAVDSKGNPLKNELVEVYDSSGNVVGKVYTDSNGKFSFNNLLNPGSYNLSVGGVTAPLEIVSSGATATGFTVTGTATAGLGAAGGAGIGGLTSLVWGAVGIGAVGAAISVTNKKGSQSGAS